MMVKRKQWLLIGVLGLAWVSIGASYWFFGVNSLISWAIHTPIGLSFYENGQYTEAEQHWVIALNEAEKSEAEDRVAFTLNRLAILYEDQGRYAEAESLFQRVLAIQEETLGPDHPDVAPSLNNLEVFSHFSWYKNPRSGRQGIREVRY